MTRCLWRALSTPVRWGGWGGMSVGLAVIVGVDVVSAWLEPQLTPSTDSLWE